MELRRKRHAKVGTAVAAGLLTVLAAGAAVGLSACDTEVTTNKTTKTKTTETPEGTKQTTETVEKTVEIEKKQPPR